MKLLQSNWIVLGLLGIFIYLGTTVALIQPSRLLGQHGDTPSEVHQTPGPNWDFTNPELDQLIAELKKEREALAAREKELNELAVRIQTEQGEISQITQMVSQLQREFDQTVLRVKDEETANLKKLAKVYATMAPEGAATILKEMEDELIIKIIVYMKESEAAPILELMGKEGTDQAKRAAKLTERMRLAMFRNPAASKTTTQ
ncbi:MAG: hypothetical protein AB1813_23530 [Verrucomicrobiota bacterium]|jgi:flagellar motility protein MotE (MotC chaperone)